ncbi:MFS transporter [Arthrobacter sp. I2-34]|uniref:MFS transporter n=1 Tax=Arthrobacter hankyongi TaxID=2904801 RepID=A0ABS9L992_9MICC|nr:MFS transporter [Arthrobacter hankyongi]MCG2623088.1 MFS transporter [Arthrobacter hankyongi]
MSKVTTRQATPETFAPPGKESRATAWGLTSVLVLLYTVNYSDKILLGLVAQPLKDEFGLTSAQIGLTASVFFFAFSAGGFFAGLINKWTTLKWSLMALALIWAICMVPMIVAGSFMVLLVSRFLLGLTEGPSGALVHTAVYSWHPLEKRSLPGAFIASANSIAKIAVAPALAFLIVQFGWHSAFVAMLVVGLGWCVLWYFTWRPGPYGEVRIPAAKIPAKTSLPSAPWMSIFLTRTFLGGLAAVIPMYALLTVILTWLPSYFEVGLGFTRLQAGSMFGIPSIAALVAMLASSYLSDKFMGRGVSSRIMRGVVPAAGLLVCGLSMAVLPYIGTPVLVVAVVSIGYGIGCIVAPIMNAAISQICPKDQVAGSLGVFLALMAIGGIIAPPLTGMIVDRAVSPAAGYAQSFQVFGIIAVLGAILAVILVNPARDAVQVMAQLGTTD